MAGWCKARSASKQATVGEGVISGRRVHTVRYGPGKMARTERLETKGVGITRLTTYASMGAPSLRLCIPAATSKLTPSRRPSTALRSISSCSLSALIAGVL
jgi:hypothetical protein